jgi:hypothetical protein
LNRDRRQSYSIKILILFHAGKISRAFQGSLPSASTLAFILGSLPRDGPIIALSTWRIVTRT